MLNALMRCVSGVYDFINAIFNRIAPFAKRNFRSSCSRIGNDGVRYPSHMMRTISIFCDWVVVMFLSQLICQPIVGFMSPVMPTDIAQKYALHFAMSANDKAYIHASIVTNLVVQSVFLVVVCVIVMIMWVRVKGSPVSLLLGIVVLNENDLSNITYKQAAIRMIMVPISILPLGIGLMCANWSDKSQTWYDKVSGTVLVMHYSLDTELRKNEMQKINDKNHHMPSDKKWRLPGFSGGILRKFFGNSSS